MESDFGEEGPQPGKDEAQEEEKECPEEQGKRRSLQAEMIFKRNRGIVLNGKSDSQHQEEKKNDPARQPHDPSVYFSILRKKGDNLR
jgi:hypothetical protein